jgi:hypothetical protein
MKKIIPLLTVILLLMTSAHAAWFSDDDKPKTTTTQDHKTYTLKLAETWPSNFPIFGDATKKLITVNNGIIFFIFSLGFKLRQDSTIVRIIIFKCLNMSKICC